MTTQELNVVWEHEKKIRELEAEIRALQTWADNIVPIIDGLPSAKTAKSSVEKIALSLVSREHELAKLKERLEQTRATLANRIVTEILKPIPQTLLILRYVECLPFKEIARRMHYGVRYIFKMHNEILKKGTCLHTGALRGHVATQGHD